jgi:hypothetical protein
MKLRPLLASLLTGLSLAGCATFTDAELGLIQHSGASPRLVGKMETGRVLTPEDVIELTRRSVPERFILRQIEDIGVDYVLSPEDFKKLQHARISPEVLDALVAASDEFSRRYAAPRYEVYPADPYYDDYYGPRYRPRVGGSIGIGISSGGPHRWRHH